MEKKTTFMSFDEWTKAGATLGATVGAGLLTMACAEYCSGLHEVLGVVTTGALLGSLPGVVGGQVCALADSVLNR